MKSKSEGILVLFLKGRLPLSTTFWLVFVPVYVVLVLGAGPIGAWWGGLAAKFDLPFMFPLYAMWLIGIVVALGAGASAWRTGGLYGNGALIVILFAGGAYLFSGFKLIFALN